MADLRSLEPGLGVLVGIPTPLRRASNEGDFEDKDTPHDEDKDIPNEDGDEDSAMD